MEGRGKGKHAKDAIETSFCSHRKFVTKLNHQKTGMKESCFIYKRMFPDGCEEIDWSMNPISTGQSTIHYEQTNSIRLQMARTSN